MQRAQRFQWCPGDDACVAVKYCRSWSGRRHFTDPQIKKGACAPFTAFGVFPVGLAELMRATLVEAVGDVKNIDFDAPPERPNSAQKKAAHDVRPVDREEVNAQSAKIHVLHRFHMASIH